MKIAFFSNFLNHHQYPICKEFIENGHQFVFVATEKIPDEREKMGYQDMNDWYFVLKTYESAENEEKAQEVAKTYDVVIFGACPSYYLALRMQVNKLSFRFSERLLKKGTWRRFVPTTRKKIKKAYIQYKDKNLYVLCASAYTSYDLSLCGFPKEKCFKWGYFPKTITKDFDTLNELKNYNEKSEILYAGRLLKLKRVIDSLKAINKLVKKGVTNLHFTIIGDGEQKVRLLKYVTSRNLQEYVTFLPFTTPEKVRQHMDEADVYVFGSDFHEGWGAVVNEAMSSACAVIASHAVGSSAFLIKDGENGYVYKCGKVKDLAFKMELLTQNIIKRKEISLNAYNGIAEKWTAKKAVENFLTICNRLLNDEEFKGLEIQGPCSLAVVIKNNWVDKCR